MELLACQGRRRHRPQIRTRRYRAAIRRSTKTLICSGNEQRRNARLAQPGPGSIPPQNRIELRGFLFQYSRNGLKQLPSMTHVALFSLRLADAEAERVPILKRGMRQIELAALIQFLEQPAIERIAAKVAEANEIERRGHR